MAIELNQSTSSDKKATSKNSLSFSLKLSNGKKLSAKDRIFFFQQILLLIQTGTPIRAGLEALKKQTDKTSIKQIMEGLITKIDEGTSFSYALSKYPDVFTSTHINLISASEEGGYMDKVLQQIIDMEERREKLRESLMSAISYPAFLAVFSMGVVVFILLVVFPKFSELFTKIHDQLPATTKFLMWLSETLTQQWMIILGIFVALVVLTLRYFRSEVGKMQLDRFKLSMPIFKHVFTQVYLVQSLRVMYLSLSNGVSIVDTLNSCKKTVQNKIYQQFLENVELKIQEGSGISAGFSKAQFIPPLVKQMISTGEETGNLATVMGKIADHYENELLKHLKTLSKMAEPIMLVIMGAVVGIIVSSLILPIFLLSRAVQ